LVSLNAEKAFEVKSPTARLDFSTSLEMTTRRNALLRQAQDDKNKICE
jgi:hypothetical protein